MMSNEAINQVRSFVEQHYGNEYLPESPRIYKSKAKNAQEAHECIRPTDINLTPKDIKQYITGEEFKLYEIIWQRAVSSQMASAIQIKWQLILLMKIKKLLLEQMAQLSNFLECIKFIKKQKMMIRMKKKKRYYQ